MSLAPIINIAPAIIAAKRNRIIRAFRKAAANSPQSARDLEGLSLTRGHMLGRMIKGGVIREEPGGRFWLDETAQTAFRKQARMMMAVSIAVVAAVVIAAMLLTRP